MRRTRSNNIFVIPAGPWSRNELLLRVREMIAYATHCEGSPCASVHVTRSRAPSSK